MSTIKENQEREDKNIYESFHKKGVLDNIKAYLRSSLVQSIKGENNLSNNNSKNLNDLTNNKNINNNLIRKAISNGDYDRIKLYKNVCSLIKDFFKKTDLNYTFSVFISECGFQDLLTEEEISKSLNISYSNLDNIGEENFLAYITKQLINSKEKNSISVQVSENDFLNISDASENFKFKGLSTAKSIEAKFKEVDEKYFKLTLLENGKLNNSNTNMNFNYSNVFENLMPAKSIEEKMIKYQRETEAKYKVELDRELLRMKEIEISNIRIEENKKYLKKLEDIRNEYDEEYSQRFENLKKREIDFNLKIANKEKELEVTQYETRQKYLNQIESLKLKQEELKIKYENDLNVLNLKQEKLNIKEKDIDNIRENANRKLQEEIENFKGDFIKNFEAEKTEVHKQKLKAEEIQFKSNLRTEQFERLENENKNLNIEYKNLKNEIKEFEERNKDYKTEIQALRDELKILSSNEKRNHDHANIKTAENESLRTENKILRENIISIKQMNEDRKNDQGVIVEDLKIQIKENTKQFNKIKEDLEHENINLRKEISDLKEKFKLNLKNNKENDENLYFTHNVKYQQQLVNTQKEIRRPLVNYEYNFDYLNLNNQDRESINYNNYFKAPNNSRKSVDDINKLEKEAEDLKQEIKNTFVNKNSNNEYNNASPIFSEYNLWNIQNKEAASHTANLEKSIINALFEKLKDSNLLANSKVQNICNNNIKSEYEQGKERKVSNKLKNRCTNIYKDDLNNSKSESFEMNNQRINSDFRESKTSLKSKEEIAEKNYNFKNKMNNNNISKKSDTSDKNSDKDNFLNVDKLYETPMFNKDNQNIYSNINKEFNLNERKNSDNSDHHNKIKKTDSKINNSNLNNQERSKEIEKLQHELEKIKSNHSQINKNEQHSRNNSKSAKNINIIDNYNTNTIPEILNNNKSNRESDHNEFSVGNITSSYDWELESHRKEKKDENKNTNNTNNIVTKLESANQPNSSSKSSLANTNQNGVNKIKLKELKDKANPISIYNSNINDSSKKKIISIKEESDEQEKENVSSFDDNNNKNNVGRVESSNKNDSHLKKNNNKQNNLSISHQKSNSKKKNLNSDTNNNQKSSKKDKSVSYVNNLTNKSNSYGEFDNTENLEGLNLKNSFNNKFSNVNFDYDQKEIEEDIKSENPSENYGDDFMEDVDNIDNKNHRLSFDLDAIKNVSNNFTGTNISYLAKDYTKNNYNNSKSKENKNSRPNNISTSNDIKYEKFYQSKNSNEDGQIEEAISMNSSKREKNIQSGKSLTIDEDSYLRNNKENGVSNEYKYNFSDNMIKSNIEDSNNNFYDQYASNNFAESNTLRNIMNSKGENSNKETSNVHKQYDSRNSEIKEELFDEDDGYEPINYD